MEGREEGMASKLLNKRETTAWYLSYRRAGYTVMHIYTDKNSAIKAACHHLDGDHERLEIGPMLGPREGNVLHEQAIRDHKFAPC